MKWGTNGGPGKKLLSPKLGKLIKKTAGGKHGWYESNIGPLRKPLQ
jgi:hypothetical protein